MYASYASVLLAYVHLLSHTASFHATLMPASDFRHPEGGAAQELANAGRELDRLVFEFATVAHEWANRS